MTATYISGSAQPAAGGSGTQSVTITAPTGIVAGYVLMAILYWSTNATGLNTITPPDGSWSTPWTYYPDAAPGALAVLTKTATGSEPGSYTSSSTYSYIGGVIVLVSGANTSTPLDGTPAYNAYTTAAGTFTAPSAAVSQSGDLQISFFASYDGYTFSTPAGTNTGPSAQTAGYWGGSAFYNAGPSSGNTTARSSTPSTSDKGYGLTVLIAPAAGDGPNSGFLAFMG